MWVYFNSTGLPYRKAAMTLFVCFLFTSSLLYEWTNIYTNENTCIEKGI